MNRRDILFCATGVLDTVGGIASANRNVLKGLETVAQEECRQVKVLALSEETTSADNYRSFNGNKLRFSMAMLQAMLSAEVVVFDHVQIAAPLLYLPRSLWPKVVICAHGSEAGKRIRSSSIKLFSRADLVLTNSSFTLGNMRRYIDRFNGKVCALGLPPQHLMTTKPPQYGEHEVAMKATDGSEQPLGPRVMLLVARMDAGEREKGHRELISVMPRLVEKVPSVQLVFVGSGTDEAELRAICTRSSAASHIFFSGKISNEQLEVLYRKCYAFVMPSRQEGFGLVYLEAMNHAKPCIACHNDGGAEIVVDRETGYLVKQPIDCDELTYVLLSLLDNPPKAAEMGLHGWQRLQDKFSAAAHQQRVAAHIRELL